MSMSKGPLRGGLVHAMQSYLLVSTAQCTRSPSVCCMHRLDTAAAVRAPAALLSSCSESCGQLQQMLATQGQWNSTLADSQQTASHLARAAVHLQEQAAELRFDVQTGVCPAAMSEPGRLLLITQSRPEHACLETPLPSHQRSKGFLWTELHHATFSLAFQASPQTGLHHATFNCGRTEQLPRLAGAISKHAHKPPPDSKPTWCRRAATYAGGRHQKQCMFRGQCTAPCAAGSQGVVAAACSSSHALAQM